MTTDIPQALQDHLKDYSDELVFWLNGKQLRISNPDPGCLLVHYLHADGLTGTKIGCEQGGCGACTVMVSRRTANRIDSRSINSCLKPIVSLAGAEVTTVRRDQATPYDELRIRCNTASPSMQTERNAVFVHPRLRDEHAFLFTKEPFTDGTGNRRPLRRQPLSLYWLSSRSCTACAPSLVITTQERTAPSRAHSIHSST